ncbi:MAG: hypothetical protein IKR25_02110 [Muribaculaceae bacterium]|nr:hypothetical protein [Muribaculaceae bacterium]
MPKICYNTRDELIVIDLDKTAYVKASGNYSIVAYITGQQSTLTVGITHIERMIALAFGRGQDSQFVRLGRSVIVNQRYLRRIDVPRQMVMLGDLEHTPIKLAIPKSLIKGYKDKVEQGYKKTTPHNTAQ